MSKQMLVRILFVVSIVSFLLPFSSVTVFDKISFSGFQFAFGDSNYMLPSYSSAIFVLIASLGGLGASFLEKKNAAILSVIASIIALFSVFSMGSKAQSGLFGGLVSFEIGYFISILAYVGICGLSTLSLKEDMIIPVVATRPNSVQKKCSNCGAIILNNTIFCSSCGQQVKNENINEVVKVSEKDSLKESVKENVKERVSEEERLRNSMFNSVPLNEPQGSKVINDDTDFDPLMQTVSIFSKPKLIGLSGPHAGNEFLVGYEKMIFGREVECNVNFEKGTPGISRIHCELSYNTSKNQFILLDKGSSYGTYLLSGEKLEVGQPYYLSNGDSFYLSSKANSYKVVITN